MNRRSFFKAILSVAVVAAAAPAKLFAAGAEKFHLWKKTLYFTIPKGTKKVTVMLGGGGGGGGSGRIASGGCGGPDGVVEVRCDLKDGSTVTRTFTAETKA